jgi:hypothetical protein
MGRMAHRWRCKIAALIMPAIGGQPGDKYNDDGANL